MAAAPRPLTELMEADEVFLTSSAGGIMPVTTVNGKVFGRGPVAEQLAKAYWELATRDARFREPLAPARPRAAEVRADSACNEFTHSLKLHSGATLFAAGVAVGGAIACACAGLLRRR